MFEKTMVRRLWTVVSRTRITSLALLVMVLAVVRASGNTLTFATPGIRSVTLPACTATIQCWGAGGNGGSCGIDGFPGMNPGLAGGGGGGGGYSEYTGTLMAGIYYFAVGQGGGVQGDGISSVGTADTIWDWNGTAGYPNHTAAFWNEVDKVIPDYGERKEWLRVNGAGMEV